MVDELVVLDLAVAVGVALGHEKIESFVVEVHPPEVHRAADLRCIDGARVVHVDWRGGGRIYRGGWVSTEVVEWGGQ